MGQIGSGDPSPSKRRRLFCRGHRLKIETASIQAIITQGEHLPGVHVTVSSLHHGNEIGPEGHGVSAELVGAVCIQRADDEAAVLGAAAVGRFVSLSAGIGGRVDDRFSTLFIPG